VIINQDMALNLYSTDGVDINISAIVGKNGSGKSSVVELLYVSLYNISAIKEVLYRENLKRKLNSKDIERDIKVELFYKEGDELLMLQLINDNIVLFKYVDGCFSEVKSKDFDFKDFFYSIAINYSHYALNSREIGDWVNNVFHKNDSYQTPLVINPMRTDGNIDINRENDLVRSRLISNILSDNEKLRVLAKGKTVKYLKFFLIDEKLQKKSRCDYDRYGEIVPFLYKYFFKDEKFEPAETQLNMYTKRYIIGKVFDICHKYKQYKYFSRFFGDSKNSSKIEEFAICLFKDNSHITFN